MPDEPTSGPPWTIARILQWTTEYFRSRIMDNPRIDAEILLAHALHCQRIDLYLHHDKPLNEVELSQYRQFIKRRIRHEPVAYIIGSKEFWSMPFVVSPDVLIPRPDTECLVEAVLEVMAHQDDREDGRKILELGVGSGAISIVLAKECAGAEIIATDISSAAVIIAAENASRYGVNQNIKWVVGHWLDPFKPGATRFDLLVSNPPYIQSGMIPSLAPEIVDYEPHYALNGGESGLDSLKQIIDQAPQYLRPGGYLICEMGFDQKEAVQEYLLRNLAYEDARFHKDYSGHYRVVQLRTAKSGSFEG